MKVSIVLPNLNGGSWLRGCIESLYAQTEQDFEIIVVDNASTDASLEDARSFCGRANYRLVENKENTGFSAGVNMGIRMAQAPYVLLFNNDAFARPDMLEKLLATMEGDGRIFAAQCLMLRHHAPDRVDDAGDFVTLFGWAYQRGNNLPAARYTKSRRIFSACGGAAIYRRSILDEIGLFEENFFAYLEDVDIGWRANSLGYKNVLCAQAVCTHIGGAATGGEKGSRYNAFKSIQSGRNSLLYIYKNMPLVMLVLNLPFTLLGYLVKTLVFHLRGFGKPWRQGMGEAFRLFGKLEKPKFRFKNLPRYFWVEGSLIASCFGFVAWRIRRIFVK